MKNHGNTEEDKLYSKKAGVKAVLGIICGVAGFAFLFAGAVMQEKGISDAVAVPVALGGFLGGDIIGLVLLLKAAPELMASDIMKNLAVRYKVYEESLLTELTQMGRMYVKQRLLQNKFRSMQEGYDVKRKFSFSKDWIYYYVRTVDDIGIENAVNRESARFNQIKKKGNAFCLILIVRLEKVDEQEKKELKDVCKKYLLSDYVFGPGAGIIIIAVDGVTDTGYYLEAPKRTVPYLYRRGYKEIGRIFKK
ncbi:MAG: hypothetical protein NC429_10825 [Lachnospiraceae bacterium]|nr:hypothetical protein [Lachnospiraceae bacterium]